MTAIRHAWSPYMYTQKTDPSSQQGFPGPSQLKLWEERSVFRVLLLQFFSACIPPCSMRSFRAPRESLSGRDKEITSLVPFKTAYYMFHQRREACGLPHSPKSNRDPDPNVLRKIVIGLDVPIDSIICNPL